MNNDLIVFVGNWLVSSGKAPGTGISLFFQVNDLFGRAPGQILFSHWIAVHLPALSGNHRNARLRWPGFFIQARMGAAVDVQGQINRAPGEGIKCPLRPLPQNRHDLPDDCTPLDIRIASPAEADLYPHGHFLNHSLHLTERYKAIF